VNDSLASVSVITREDIKRLQVQSLPELLRNQPGVGITNNGGPGKSTSVFLRGSESDHVLVLIDGVKVGSATLGTTPFQDIPIAQIERIEIVRGPRSSLYGSEAVGGVIQIFTARGGGPLQHELSLDLGSHKTRGASASVSGGGQQGWYRMSLDTHETDGIDACQNTPLAGCRVIESDQDGYRNGSASLRTGYRFNNRLEIDAHVLYTDSDNEFDGSFVNESESQQQVIGGHLQYEPVDSWRLSLSGGRSWDKSDNLLDGELKSRFNTTRDSISLQSDHALNLDHQVIFGLDYQKDVIDSKIDYEQSEQDSHGYFAQYQAHVWHQDLELSLRQDDFASFGKQTTGNIAWGYSWKSGFRTTLSYGTAFKTPTFNERYYPDYGNPDLEPEESKSTELGLHGPSALGSWSLNLFETRIEQLIGSDANYQPANIDEARIRGIEARLATQTQAWHIDTNLTLLDPRNESSGDRNNNVLPRRSRRLLRIDMDRDIGLYTFGLSLVAEASRYDDLDNQKELGGYGVLDLRLTYPINKTWQLQGRCENLFDKSYETAAFYNQPGRGFYLTLRHQS
jgi:vitamin B12 transporter